MRVMVIPNRDWYVFFGAKWKFHRSDRMNEKPHVLQD